MQATHPVDEEETDRLSDDTREKIRRLYSDLSSSLPGFKPRGSQRRMIAEVARTLSGECYSRILAVEGPTGVGKSLAYLLSAIPVANARKKTLVISTATVALQEQLVDKDLPGLQAHTDFNFSYRLAKGRGRYICDRELDTAAQNIAAAQESLIENEALWSIRPEPGDTAEISRMVEQRADGTWDGDFDAWPSLVRPAMRAMLGSTGASCTKRQCPFFDDCAYYAERAKRDACDVIVANHALVVSDLLMGGGVVLTDPEETIYVFDEGHHLPSVALIQAQASVTSKGTKTWLENIDRVTRDVAQLVPLQKYGADLSKIENNLSDDKRRLNESLDDLHRFLREAFPTECQDKSERWRVDTSLSKNADLMSLFKQAAPHAANIQRQLEALKKVVDTAVKDKDASEEAIRTSRTAIIWTLARIETAAGALERFSEQDQTDAFTPPQARWIEQKPDGSDFVCSVSETSSARLLQKHLWSVCDGAIVTSATLTSLGHFDRYFEQAGLSNETAQSLRLKSPFDFQRNATLHVPLMRTLPTDADAHTEELIGLANDGLIDSREGTLFLFSSHRQMRAVAGGLSEPLRKQTLIQSDRPRAEIIAAHLERIQSGQGSLIMGVASFSEGLDLPGNLCSHVIIAKLAFSVPTSPVDATYSEWLKSNGRNPFFEVALPDAGFRLTQACGRLIRTETDTGRVTILDRRIVTKRYGQSLLDGLPHFERRIEAHGR